MIVPQIKVMEDKKMDKKTQMLVELSEIIKTLSAEDINRLIEYVEVLKGQHTQ